MNEGAYPCPESGCGYCFRKKHALTAHRWRKHRQAMEQAARPDNRTIEVREGPSRRSSPCRSRTAGRHRRHATDDRPRRSRSPRRSQSPRRSRTESGRRRPASPTRVALAPEVEESVAGGPAQEQEESPAGVGSGSSLGLHTPEMAFTLELPEDLPFLSDPLHLEDEVLGGRIATPEMWRPELSPPGAQPDAEGRSGTSQPLVGRNLALIPLETPPRPLRDPRLAFLRAPSVEDDSPVGTTLRAFHRQALSTRESPVFRVHGGYIAQVEQATLPDGTRYRLESRWVPDPRPPVCLRHGSSQTDAEQTQQRNQ